MSDEFKASRLYPVLAFLLAFSALMIYLSISGSAAKQFAPVVDEITPLVESCKIMGHQGIFIQGKCFVWDIPKHAVSPAHGHLPKELRASSSDKEVTFFLVLQSKPDAIEVGQWMPSGFPAFRHDWPVAVIYWPQKKAAGMLIVSQHPPSQAKKYGQLPGPPLVHYGDHNKAIAERIAGLPRR